MMDLSALFASLPQLSHPSGGTVPPPMAMEAPPAPMPAAPVAPPMAPAAPPMAAPPLPVPEDDGSGNGWASMLKKILPIVLSQVAMKSGGPAAAGALLEGFTAKLARRRQEEAGLALDERDRNDQLSEKAQAKRERAAMFVQNVANSLQDIDDPAAFARAVDLAATTYEQAYGLPSADIRQAFVFPEGRDTARLQKDARSLVDSLTKRHGDNWSKVVEGGALVPFNGKDTPIADVMALAGEPFTKKDINVPIPANLRGGTVPVKMGEQRTPIVPEVDETEQATKSVTGTDRRANLIRARIRALGRRPNAEDRLRIEEEVDEKILQDELRLRSASRSTRSTRSGNPAAARNPRGANAIPQGVERYIIDMRNRGYTQSEAASELLSREVWANMQRDHPTMTAQRARAAIAQLIPEEGALPSATGGRGSGAGRSGEPAVAGAPDDRVMSMSELQAAADLLGIDVEEARREYERRGFVIR